MYNSHGAYTSGHLMVFVCLYQTNVSSLFWYSNSFFTVSHFKRDFKRVACFNVPNKDYFGLLCVAINDYHLVLVSNVTVCPDPQWCKIFPIWSGIINKVPRDLAYSWSICSCKESISNSYLKAWRDEMFRCPGHAISAGKGNNYQFLDVFIAKQWRRIF